MTASNKSVKPRKFKKPEDALAYICAVYEGQTAYLRAEFKKFVNGGARKKGRVSGFYPYIKITTDDARRLDSRLAYGFVPRPGSYVTTVTRPDIFGHYYLEQLRLLASNHAVSVEVGLSDTPIPIHFALGEDYHLEKKLSEKQVHDFPFLFDVPDLELMDDALGSGTKTRHGDEDQPLSLFSAPRVDLSLQRLRHYCGSAAEHFQNYVIFTNYQFYIDSFVKLGRARAGKDGYTKFVEPAEAGRLPQMPAYHLKRKDHSGITMVNIGVGPSNAKTITDHLAVLRPHAWLMLGHCAGLRNSQKLGDYVLAHGYLREDNILDDEVPLSIPIPALAEIQKALESAVAKVTGKNGYDLKSIMRTGTVATTADRNWELGASIRQNNRLSQSRAIAMDMESGTIAANGFRFRVPYGTLLCVSDKPLHGQLKLPGMANAFYRERVEQHLQIGLLTMTMLRDLGLDQLHSRKLRSFNEVAFR